MACDAKYIIALANMIIYSDCLIILFTLVVLGFLVFFRGKIVLGYTEAELRVRGSGYQFIHAADMLYCAENHVRSKSQLFYILYASLQHSA